MIQITSASKKGMAPMTCNPTLSFPDARGRTDVGAFMGNRPLRWSTQIFPWINFLVADSVWYWAETEGEPPIAWAPEGQEVQVGNLPHHLGKWAVTYVELPPNQLTGEPMCKGEAKVGKRWRVLVNHPDPSKVAMPTRDNRDQRVGLTEWLVPPQSTREKEWTMPLILFSDSLPTSQAPVRQLEVSVSPVTGETGFPAVPLTWSESQVPTPEK